MCGPGRLLQKRLKEFLGAAGLFGSRAGGCLRGLLGSLLLLAGAFHMQLLQALLLLACRFLAAAGFFGGLGLALAVALEPLGLLPQLAALALDQLLLAALLFLAQAPLLLVDDRAGGDGRRWGRSKSAAR